MTQQTLFDDPTLICGYCGTVEPNDFLLTINHSLMGASGLCARQWARAKRRKNAEATQ